MYTFKNTERNNEKASDFETKSMLYLLSMRNDSHEIEIIAVDCFNDVTGGCSNFFKMWDIQSKNHKTLNPAKIGESLITLYKNFTSEFEFHELILFTPKLNRDYLIEKEINIFKFSNFNASTQKRIREKLLNIINEKEITIKNNDMDLFLDKVIFVEDKNNKEEYIKSIIKFKNMIQIKNEIYNNIFNEIRDKQTIIKNSFIENITIAAPCDVLKLNRHIEKKSIEQLIINRLIGIDIFSTKMIPIYFMSLIRNIDLEEVKDIIQNCNSQLSTCFFDKNGKNFFWSTIENIVEIIKCGEKDVNIIYDQIDKDLTEKKLDDLSMKYLVSLILQGFESDN